MIPDNINLDPKIRLYLSNLPKIPKESELKNKIVEGLLRISFADLGLVDRPKKETSATEYTEKLQKFNFLHSPLTLEELKQLESLLTIDGNPGDPNFVEGDLSKIIHFGINSSLRTDCRTLQNIRLKDEIILTRMEQVVLKLFTESLYLLINGTLDNDKTSLNMFINSCFFRRQSQKPKTEDAKKKFLEDAQKYVPLLAKTLASFLGKLPQTENEILYRGDAMKVDDIKDWYKGKFLIPSKFLCCSTNIEIGEKFAKDSAIDYMKDTGVAYKPVLYVMENKSAKSIKDFAFNVNEEERTFTPGQIFHSINVDEETVPGLAIIYLEEYRK